MADLGVEETLYRQEFTDSLDASDLTFITSFGREVKISFLAVHVDTTYSVKRDLKVFFDSITGPNYDFLLILEDMKNASDFLWYPDQELFLKAGDELRVVVPQLTGATAYITSIARQA